MDDWARLLSECWGNSAAGSNPALPAGRKIFDVAAGSQSTRLERLIKFKGFTNEIAQCPLGGFAFKALIWHCTLLYRMGKLLLAQTKVI